MISNNELYQLLLKLPLSSEDIGRLYQYLTSKGGGGGSEGIEDILKLIPAEASETNKLADKAFVESIISPDAGIYISKDDSGVPFDSYDELIKYRGSIKNNDYALVAGKDSNNNDILIPYKATVSGDVVLWNKKYKDFAFVNNVLSEANFAAMRSGINQTLVVRLVNIVDLIPQIVPEGTTETNKLTNEKYVNDMTEEATDTEVQELLNK